MTAYLIRIDPRHVIIHDLVDLSEPDESLWLVEAEYGDDQVIPLDDLRNHIASWIDPNIAVRHGPGAVELMADVHLMLLLWHPKSPYGLGYRVDDPPEVEGGDPVDMMVVFHGHHYTRDPDGVLTPLGTRDDDWPTREQWRRAQIRTRLFARRWLRHLPRKPVDCTCEEKES